MENPIMTLTMEDGGKIVAELYPEKAPQSVRNFISLQYGRSGEPKIQTAEPITQTFYIL